MVPSPIPQAIVTVVLSVLGLLIAIRFFKTRQQRDGEKVNWSPTEAVGITIAIYFASQIAIALALGVFISLFGVNTGDLANELDGTVPQFIYILSVQALSIWLLYQFMKRRRTPWSAIGWVKPRLRDVAYALGGFAVYFVGYAFIVATLVEKYLPIDTDQRQQLGFDTSVVGPELVFIFMSLVILPPLVEEILVRGFLFTGLRNKLPLFSAAIVTSIVFAVAHLQWGSETPLLWSAAIDTFVLSMVLVYVRHRSGSLWPGIGIHFLKNGIAFLALFVFKVV